MSKIKSLEELSINSIFFSFDRFSEAYNKKLKTYERNIEFLQRKYSAEILKRLNEKNAFKDEYLDLILNKYVRELDTSMFDCCTWAIVEKKLIEIGDVILVLTLSKNITHEQRKNVIKSLKNVEILNFETKCNDDVMKVVGEHCPKLIKLNICGTAVTNKGLKFLYLSNNNEIKNNIPLKHIILSETQVNKEGLTLLLNNVPSLEIVDHPCITDVICFIYNHSIKNNEKMKKYNLTSLTLNYFSKADVLLPIYLEMCPNLKCLIFQSLTSMNELILCQKFSSLQEVDIINDNNSQPFDINEFIKLKGNTFRILSLKNFRLSVKILVESCPKLESLKLNMIQYDEVTDTNLPSLKHLTQLGFVQHYYGNLITAELDALLISICPNLELLTIYACESFCDKINNALLKRCSTLKEIDFSFTDVEMKHLEAILLSASSLEILNLTYCSKITELDYTNLHDLSKPSMNVKIHWANDESDFSNSDEEFYIGDDDIDDFSGASSDPYDCELYYGFDDYDIDYDEDDY